MKTQVQMSAAADGFRRLDRVSARGVIRRAGYSRPAPNRLWRWLGRSLLCAGVLALALSASRAQEIHLKARGVVTDIYDNDPDYNLDGSVTNGSPFEADFTIDLSATDTRPATNDFSQYYFPRGGGTARVGTYVVGFAAPYSDAYSVIFDNSFGGADVWQFWSAYGPPQGAVIRSGTPLSAQSAGFVGIFAISLRDDSAQAVASKALTVPKLGDWRTAGFSVWLNRADGQMAISGPLTQLEAQPQLSIVRAGTGVELCWKTESNTVYQVQYRSNLGTNAWIDLGAPVTGGQVVCVPNAIAEPSRFYRLVVLP